MHLFLCDKIVFVFTGPRFANFRRLCVTAGSPLNHFDLGGERDGILITWSHGVNSQQELDNALNSEWEGGGGA